MRSIIALILVFYALFNESSTFSLISGFHSIWKTDLVIGTPCLRKQSQQALTIVASIYKKVKAISYVIPGLKNEDSSFQQCANISILGNHICKYVSQVELDGVAIKVSLGLDVEI